MGKVIVVLEGYCYDDDEVMTVKRFVPFVNRELLAELFGERCLHSELPTGKASHESLAFVLFFSFFEPAKVVLIITAAKS